MNAVLNRAELDHFRSVIAGRLGLQFDDGKLEFLADVLRQRLEAGSLTSTAYLGKLSSNSREELRELASRLTVSETYFFRAAPLERKHTRLPLRCAIASRRLPSGTSRSKV